MNRTKVMSRTRPYPLLTITGRAKKCGPAALSAIGRVSTHFAAELLRHLFQRTAINGTSEEEMVAALLWLGFTPTEMICSPKYRPWAENTPAGSLERVISDQVMSRLLTVRKGITLGKWLDSRREGIWIVCASKHWFAYSDGQVADSGFWFGRKPIDWERSNPACEKVRFKRISHAIGFRTTWKVGKTDLNNDKSELIID